MSGLKRSFLGLIIMVLLLAIFLNYWDVVYGRMIAASFFNNIKSGNFQNASTNVYFTSHLNNTVSLNNSSEKWVSRVQDLKNKGTYIVDYQDLKVVHDDGEAIGKVNLTLIENGKRNNYSVIFYFDGNIYNFGIARFENLFDPGQTSEWQTAISGEI